MAGINYDPVGQFLGGYNTGQQQQFENKTVTDQADYAKRTQEKQDLSRQFSDQIKQVTDILKNTNDPAQREAVIKALDQAKVIYTGPAAQQYSLDQMFAKQIDFAKQTPYEQRNLGGGSGKKGASPEDTAAAQAADAQYKIERANNSLGTIDRAMQMLQGGDEKFIDPVTGQEQTITGTANDWIPFNEPDGVVAQVTKGIDSAPAGRLENLYSQLRSQEAFRELQRLKNASATGASGLGAVAVKEFEALQQAISRLNVGLPKRDQMVELGKLKTAYSNLLELAKQYDAEQAGLGADSMDAVPPLDESMLSDQGRANAAAVLAPAAPMPGANVDDPVMGLDGTTPSPVKPTKRIRFDAQGNMIQ